MSGQDYRVASCLAQQKGRYINRMHSRRASLVWRVLSNNILGTWGLRRVQLLHAGPRADDFVPLDSRWAMDVNKDPPRQAVTQPSTTAAQQETEKRNRKQAKKKTKCLQGRQRWSSTDGGGRVVIDSQQAVTVAEGELNKCVFTRWRSTPQRHKQGAELLSCVLSLLKGLKAERG